MNGKEKAAEPAAFFLCFKTFAALFGEQFDNVTDGLDVFGIVVGNGDVEFFAESVDQEELIHGICLQIFNKAGFGRNIGAVDLIS